MEKMMESKRDLSSAIVIFDKGEQRMKKSDAAMHRTKIGEMVAEQAMAWCSCWIQAFPIRMTLNNLGLLTVFLAIVLPRSFIYKLVYPIFRLVFGTLYPAYASYKAVRTKNVKEYVKWMMYWIVFALFTCAETFTDVFFSFWFPFYYEIKIILVLWLLSPATKGSSILYRRFVHPALIRREAEIDEALARATEQGYTAVLHLGTKGVNYATTVLMQTAIKGGGGLVQQLRKSYSLSDLTGEKEDENRNTTDTPDETDMEEPRRREHVGRRGYSPRRTQSSSNRVDMYFSEVDVDVRQARPREPVASLTNIRSSDDISSGYSSGEALQNHRTVTQGGDSLVRTSSVGARTRMKPRTTTKKTPEDWEEDFNRVNLPFPQRISLPSSLNVLTPEQAVEFLLFLARNNKAVNAIESDIEHDPADNNKNVKENRSIMKLAQNESSAESNVKLVRMDPAEINIPTIQTIEIKNISAENLSTSAATNSMNETNSHTTFQQDSIHETNFQQDHCNVRMEYINDKSNNNKIPSVASEKPDTVFDVEQITGEICQQKFDELKQLLSDAHKAVATIVSSQEKLSTTEEGKKCNINIPDTKNSLNDNSRNTCVCDNIIHQTIVSSSSNCSINSDNRAGKYNKKPAPKVPLTTSEDDINESEPQNAVKATLVIKTGTLKTISNTDATKDIFLAHVPESTKKTKKKSNKLRAKESISKLLTIPRNIFQNAFQKERSESPKEEDSSSTGSGSASRSNSIGSQMVDVTAISSPRETDVEGIPLASEHDDNVKSFDKKTNCLCEESDTKIATTNEIEAAHNKVIDTVKDKKDTSSIVENCERYDETKSNFEIRQVSQPLYNEKKIVTDIN